MGWGAHGHILGESCQPGERREAPQDLPCGHWILVPMGQPLRTCGRATPCSCAVRERLTFSVLSGSSPIGPRVRHLPSPGSVSVSMKCRYQPHLHLEIPIRMGRLGTPGTEALQRVRHSNQRQTLSSNISAEFAHNILGSQVIAGQPVLLHL